MVFGACTNAGNKQGNKEDKSADVIAVPFTDSLTKLLIKRGNSISTHAQFAFQKALKNAIETGGVEYAIRFCNTKALPITDSVSQAYKVEIRRLAKKNRNPANGTDEIESRIFKDYIMAWLDGRKLYARIVVNKEGQPVYYKPIGIKPVCLNCHGVPGKDIPPKTAEIIAGLYPNDKAVDFKLGELRGMWAITFPEYEIVQHK